MGSGGRNDDRAGAVERGERTHTVDGKALVGPNARTVGRGEEQLVRPRVHDLGSGEAEHLADHRELEGRHAVRHEGGNHVWRSHRTATPRR